GRIAVHRRVLEREPIHVRYAPGCGEHVIELLGHFHIGTVSAADRHALAIAIDAADLRIRLEHEFPRKRFDRGCAYFRVGDRSDSAAAPEHYHAHAEPMQRLPELETDHTGADHSHRCGQIAPFEDVIVDDETVAQLF